MGENIWNHISDKGLISKYINNSYNSIANNLIKKLAEYLNRHFSKEDTQMAKTYMKKCSTSLISRQMQIKTSMTYHLTSVKIAIIKKTRDNKYWQGCKRKETIMPCWWEYKLVQPIWKTVWRFLKTLKIQLAWLRNSTSGYFENTNLKRYTHLYFRCSTIYRSQDTKTATEVSSDGCINKENVCVHVRTHAHTHTHTYIHIYTQHIYTYTLI